ncbi:hypothetical protein C0585_06435 [Candidatus Woesearchaeota archaeon]|nr:MAG: hypothetical protein C0585_06435 [Candidatus Woesearchaeota archaeon]
MKMILIRGPLGVGKTTISKKLTKIIDGRYYLIDKILEDNDLDHLDEKEGFIPLKNFNKINKIILNDITSNKLESYIIDGCFYYIDQINQLKKLFGSKLIIFSLKASLKSCILRDKNRKNSLGTKATKEVYNKVNEVDIGIPIHTENKKEEDIIREIINKIN